MVTTIDELMDAVCDEMVAYESFWEEAPEYMLLGIEEMAILETIAHGRDILLSTFLGLRVVPVHDLDHYIGVA